MEERPDRPVDEARGQHLLLARPTLALEEAAGDLARSEGLLLVVDGQRKEIDAGLGRFRGDGGAEDDSVAIADHDGAIGLAGDATGLENELAPAPFDLLAEDVEHRNLILSGSGRIRGAGPAQRAAATGDGLPRRS
jgi:hypothetical protein